MPHLGYDPQMFSPIQQCLFFLKVGYAENKEIKISHFADACYSLFSKNYRTVKNVVSCT